MQARLFHVFSLTALILVMAAAAPAPQEDIPEDSDDAADIENGATVGIDDDDSKPTSQYTYPVYVDDMGAMVTCQTHGIGTFDTQDRATLLNGWIAYSALSANSGGPYLAGLSETVFCTGEAGYDSYGGYAGNTPADGHQYCNSCLTDGINNGADDIWCQVNNRADDDTATFNDHMYHGGNPSKDPSGLCADDTQ